MALTQTQIDSIKFHLGYTNDLYYSGANAYLERILSSLTATAETNIIALITRCDNAFTGVGQPSTYFDNITTQEASGDANITNVKTTPLSYSKRLSIYNQECQLLADSLGVDCYRV